MLKKKTLKKLASYSVATSAALAVSTPADGQIQYSGYQDITIGTGSNYSIDFNGDFTDEVFLSANFNSNSGSMFTNAILATNPGYAYMNGFQPSVQPMSVGASINSSLAWTKMYSNAFLRKVIKTYTYSYSSTSYAITATNTNTNSFGLFPEGTTKYIGVKFDVSVNTYYGWIRVEVMPGTTSLRIIDWAYQTTPSTPIIAGDKGDVTPPIITCPGDQSQDGDASCEAVLADFTSMAVVSDDLDPFPVVTQSPLPGTTISSTTTITLTASDESLNTSNCTFDVFISDVMNPTITCPGNQTVNADATCEAALPDYTAMAVGADNCDISPLIVQSPSPGTTISGINTVTLTITDANSNFSDCSFDVEVIDVTAPVVVAPSDQVIVSGFGCEGTLPNYTTVAGISDNCDISPVLSQYPAPGSTISAPTVVTIYAEDADGNIGSGIFNVTVQDVINPSITCPGDQAIDLNGSCEAVMPDYTSMVVTSDNCTAILDVVQNPAPGTLVYEPTSVTITSTDDGGNSSFCSFEADLNTSLNSISTTQGNINCFGQSTGWATVSVNGCSPVYHYQWSNGGTTNSITGVPAGSYSVTVSDASGNSLIKTVSISQPAFLNANITVANVPCGTSSGSASASVNGGTPPYNYLWSTGDETNHADNLPADMYSLYVTDNVGCNSLQYFNVNNIGGPVIANNGITDVNCNNQPDGAIDISITGGILPYNIEWSTGTVTEDLTGLFAGSYDVSVTDAAGCFASAIFTVSQPTVLSVEAFYTTPGCGLSDGEISAIVNGGTAPYSYSWSSGGNAVNETGLNAGNYSLSVTDDNACALIRNFALNNSSGPVINIDSVYTVSCGESDGAIYTSIVGGVLPYTLVEWDNGAISDDITGLSTGDFELTVIDDNNCMGVLSYDLNYTLPLEQPICMVRVDSITGTNMVVWEKVENTGIDYYNIYRETFVANEFVLVDNVPYDSISVFVDTAAHPEYRSWRYKISSVDVCGTEGPKSEPHKTMHLTVNVGLSGSFNLVWDYYSGFPYSSYEIYRHTDITGWEFVEGVPANVFSYTDNPASEDGLNYVIAVMKEDGSCLGTKDVGGPYSQSVSNLEDNVLGVKVKEIILGKDVRVYPNPVRNELIIDTEIEIEKVEVYSVIGNLVMQTFMEKNLNVETLMPGVYFVKVFNKEGEIISVSKVVKE